MPSRSSSRPEPSYWSQRDRACIVPLGIHLRTEADPAVFDRVFDPDSGDKKSIYVITTDGDLVQLWDTDVWNLDFPARQASGGQCAGLRFRAGPAVIGRGGPDATGGKKSIYAVTTDGRLAQLWDTDVWNLDFPAERANGGQYAGLRFQGKPVVIDRIFDPLTGDKKSIYVITTDGRLAQLWDTVVWNLDLPADHF